jgi:hypothetical protein
MQKRLKRRGAPEKHRGVRLRAQALPAEASMTGRVLSNEEAKACRRARITGYRLLIIFPFRDEPSLPDQKSYLLTFLLSGIRFLLDRKLTRCSLPALKGLVSARGKG